ncbi:MAG: FeoB-associated Cys-rich membrane protein [Cyclobacteriaceae bacterium]|jgi:hypothetical protein|nr:FeoB-associated Cys-rich membrane protein [Cyclobacteriaceae bacterium]
MVQQFIILGLFVAAAIYLGSVLYRSFQAKNACKTGCGKCGSLDLQKVENDLKSKGF